MQRNPRNFDTPGGQRVQHLRCKVQSGCWSGNRTALVRKDRLIALAIRIRIIASDVRRQGHMAYAVEDCKEILHWVEAKQPFAVGAALKHFGFEFDGAGGRGKDQALTDGYFSAWTNEGAPEVFSSRLGEHHFDAAGRLLPLPAQRTFGVEARRNHAAVVQHQQVSRPQQRRKLGKGCIPRGARGAAGGSC